MFVKSKHGLFRADFSSLTITAGVVDQEFVPEAAELITDPLGVPNIHELFVY